MGEDPGGRRRGSTQALKGTVQGGPLCVGVGGADHMGELGFNQGLVDRLGGRPDADDAVTAFDTWTSDLTMALMGRGPACSHTSKLQSGVRGSGKCPGARGSGHPSHHLPCTRTPSSTRPLGSGRVSCCRFAVAMSRRTGREASASILDWIMQTPAVAAWPPPYARWFGSTTVDPTRPDQPGMRVLTAQHGREDSIKRRRHNPGQIIRKLCGWPGCWPRGDLSAGQRDRKGGTPHGTRQRRVEPPCTGGWRHSHRTGPRIRPVKGRYTDAWRRANRPLSTVCPPSV